MASIDVFLFAEGPGLPKVPVCSISEEKAAHVRELLTEEFPSLDFTFRCADSSKETLVLGCMCNRGLEGRSGEEVQNVCLSADFYAGSLREADLLRQGEAATNSPPYPRYGESSAKLTALLLGQSPPVATAATIPVAPPKSEMVPPSPDKEPKRPSKEALALAVLADHPDWSMKAIAKAVPCNRATLYDFKKFMAAREIIREGKNDLPRGSKYPDENMEAWDNEEDG